LLPVRASGLSQVPLADTQQHADVQRCLIVETEQTPVTTKYGWIYMKQTTKYGCIE
jgi:hypothetical protein